MTESIHIRIRADQVEEYRRKGWTVEPVDDHHADHRPFLATKPVEGLSNLKRMEG